MRNTLSTVAGSKPREMTFSIVCTMLSIASRWWLAPLFPICALLFAYIQWRAVYLTYRTGGITWRGTHYSLDELRANKV